jgi:molecular chaperone DnaK
MHLSDGIVHVTTKDKATKLVGELHKLVTKGQTGDTSVTADTIHKKIGGTQNAFLGLFQKVYKLTSPYFL